MSDRVKVALAAALFGAIVAGNATVIVWASDKDDREARRACKDAGGTVLPGSGGCGPTWTCEVLP